MENEQDEREDESPMAALLREEAAANAAMTTQRTPNANDVEDEGDDWAPSNDAEGQGDHGTASVTGLGNAAATMRLEEVVATPNLGLGATGASAQNVTPYTNLVTQLTQHPSTPAQGGVQHTACGTNGGTGTGDGRRWSPTNNVRGAATTHRRYL